RPPLVAHDRQLHRPAAQALRAGPRAPASLPHHSRHRLPLHRGGRGGGAMSSILLSALRGEATPRRPLWVMRQAGRYLPEYRALRAKHSFEELSGSAELAAEVTLQPLARFPLDAAIIFADLM